MAKFYTELNDGLGQFIEGSTRSSTTRMTYGLMVGGL